MNFGHWSFPLEFDTINWFGFVYRITELSTSRQYIGKKQFEKLSRKIVKGRKNRKHVKSQSNWKIYTGSCKALNESIELNGLDGYKFEIESLHKTKGSLHYAEVCLQIEEDVLRATMKDGITKKYYNRNIAGVKFIPPFESVEEFKMKSKRYNALYWNSLSTIEKETLKEKFLNEAHRTLDEYNQWVNNHTAILIDDTITFETVYGTDTSLAMQYLLSTFPISR